MADDPNCSGAKGAFIITLCVLLIVIVVAIAVVIYAVVTINRFVDVLYQTVYNENECEIIPEKCQYIDIQPVLPTSFPDQEFSPEVALLGAQLILNSEWLTFNNGDLRIPPGLVFSGALQGCPGCDYRRGGFRDRDTDSTIPLGYMVTDPQSKTLYIAYRGAITSLDWQAAFAFDEVLIPQRAPFDKSAGGVELPGSSNIPVTCTGVAVHSGFLFLFESVVADLIRLVVENRDNVERLVIYGHSLGGPLASLSGAFLLLGDIFNKPIYIYTYGKPRVGNVAYARCIDSLFGRRFWRMQNDDDVIGAIPLSASPNFSDPSHPWVYEHEGTLYYYQLNWASQTLNHNLNNYIASLQVQTGRLQPQGEVI